MSENAKKWYRIATGLLYGGVYLSLLLAAIYYYMSYADFLGKLAFLRILGLLLASAGMAMVAVGLLCQNIAVSKIGAILGGIGTIFNALRWLPTSIISEIWLVAYCFLLFALLSKEGKTKTLGIIMTILAALHILLMESIGSPNILAQGYNTLRFIASLLMAAAAILLIKAVSVGGVELQKVKTNSVIASKTSGDIEKLMQLKTMLDRGIITQEEFETKRRELLQTYQ